MKIISSAPATVLCAQVFMLMKPKLVLKNKLWMKFAIISSLKTPVTEITG